MRNEDPPNKDVHPSDLTAALEQIGRKLVVSEDPEPMDLDSNTTPPRSPAKSPFQAGRTRADSRTIVFEPSEHGHSPDLPAIAVEDTTESPTELAPEDASNIIHTARPPVELMS